VAQLPRCLCQRGLVRRGCQLRHGQRLALKRNAVNRGVFRNAAWSAAPPPSEPGVLFLPVGVVRPTIQRGQVDSGAETYVSDLQQWLAFLGYPVEQTGSFDDATHDAVVAFQRDERFTADGTVDALTWAALGFVVPSM
jgi:hypothetical protein